jgi:hypothetical protein
MLDPVGLNHAEDEVMMRAPSKLMVAWMRCSRLSQGRDFRAGQKKPLE